MTQIIVPSRRVWTQQPQQPGLSPAFAPHFVWSGAFPSLDLSAQRPVTVLNGTFPVDGGGRSFFTTLVEENSKLYCTLAPSPGSNFIAVVQYETLTDEIDGIFLAGKTAWFGANGFMFESKTNVDTLEINGGNESTFPTISVPSVGKADGKVHTLVVRYRGASAAVFFDGRSYGSVNIVAPAGEWPSGIGIGNYASTASGNAQSRKFYLAAIVLNGDPLSLSANPWQLFSRRDRRTIIDFGASGTTAVYADSALTYYIRSLLSSDSGIQYAIRNAIYKDDAVGYFLRSAIAQNSEVGYVLRSAIAKDDAEAYKIRGLVQASDAEAYSIRGLVQTSDGEAYKIRSQVQADTSTSYDIQSSTSVASSNAVNYSVRGAVAASELVGYSVRGSAQRDAASAYSVRSAASRDVVASYAVSASASSVYADSTASYLVDGVVPSGPSAESIAAAVLAALQATTIPANIKQVNDVTVQGAGTKLNPWQPV